MADRSPSMLVMAGAGSGKTRVLVERYVSLLDEYRVSEIAAVTFTDAAAREMRERVRHELLTRPELAHHRAEVDEAVIGTIHSLCRMILQEHPVEASIDPAASILSDDEAEFELVRACSDVLEEAAEANDYRALALREVGVFHATAQLRAMVERRDEVEAAFQAMTGDTVEGWATHVRVLMDEITRSAVDEARPELAEDAYWLEDAHDGSDDDALAPRLRECLEALGDPNDGDWADLLARVQQAEKSIDLRGGRAKNWIKDLGEVKDALRRIRETARRLGKLPCWNEHDEDALYALSSLRLLFIDACERYQTRKQRLAALDYLDLEIEATRLLESHPEIAASYRSRFHHLMVDEMQDTNPSQIALFDLLSRGADGGSPATDRFFVGDVKQAIYRFRRSDVRSFTKLHREIKATGAVHALSRSFRAHDPLVETLNVLFGAVFDDPREEFEAPMQAMTGRGTGSTGPVHLAVLPISTEKVENPDAGERERRRVEADAVGREVASLLRGGAAVWDRDTKETRAARPSDVAILLRRWANVHLFEQALESHGVPYRTPAGLGFFSRQEVLDLTNLLGWLAEPDDEIALVGALRSPLFMIDDASLLALRSTGDPLLSGLGSPPDSVAEEARHLCVRAAEVLDQLVDEVPFASSDALLEHALALTGFEAAWAPLQGGDQALGNIRKFAGLARTLADHSLDEFVAYIRRRRDMLEAREGQAVLDDADAVRLLTVHGAKGLEFPIVFVPEAHLSPRRSYESVRWRSEEGVSLTLIPKIDSEDQHRRRPGFYAYLMERDQVEEAAEHKRLFYVAATRAADLLYISGDDTDKDDSWLAAARSVLEEADLEGVEVHPPLPVDLAGIASRPRPTMSRIPAAGEEEDFMPPLVARPRAVPLRSSTPVTALQSPFPAHVYDRHGDGLGLVRGSLAHRAIEVWFTQGARPALWPLAQKRDTGLDEHIIARVVGEVDAMLDLLDASPLAGILRDGDTRAYFELPFSWDWQGVPVHGTIDLAYESGDEWHVLDFKTDDLRGRSLAEAAEAYLPQLALYASALERATGRRPVASLLFLRTCELYAPKTADLDLALEATRRRVDAGEVVDTLPPSASEDQRLLD